MPWETGKGAEQDWIVHRTMFYEKRKWFGRTLWTFQVPYNLVRTAGEMHTLGGNTFLEPKSILMERHIASKGTANTCLQFISEDRVDEIAPHDNERLPHGCNSHPDRKEEQLHRFDWWPES